MRRDIRSAMRADRLRGRRTLRGFSPLDTMRGGAGPIEDARSQHPRTAEEQRVERAAFSIACRLRGKALRELEDAALHSLRVSRLARLLASIRHAPPERLQHVCRVSDGRAGLILFEVSEPSRLRRECLARGFRFESGRELLASYASQED